MKRLFEVVGGDTKDALSIVPGRWYFPNKQFAKEFRDLGKGRKIVLGPDHWRYKHAVVKG